MHIVPILALSFRSMDSERISRLASSERGAWEGGERAVRLRGHDKSLKFRSSRSHDMTDKMDQLLNSSQQDIAGRKA